MYKRLYESVEAGDLARLLHNEVHIDQFKSKMGNDEDIVVISFKITDKEPALDLVDFVEKGYDWVLDADTSSGEKEDGDYIVFVEIERTEEVPEQIVKMLTDIINLVDFDYSDWRWRYSKELTDRVPTAEEFRAVIPLSPEDYRAKFKSAQDDLDKLKAASGVKVDTAAPKNEFTESLRIAAGIR